MRSKDSSNVASHLNPVRGVRDAQRRAGIKPTNFAAKNREHIRSLQEAIRQKKQQSQPKKKDRFKSVQSRVLQTMEKEAGGGHVYLKKNSQKEENKTAPNFRRKAKRKPEVPRQTQNNSPSRRPVKNFVADNTDVNKHVKKAKEAEEETHFLEREDFGKVPDYLIKRRLEMAEKKALEQARTESAKIPTGMRIMPEEEKAETLTFLETNKLNVEASLQHLPLVVETPSMKRKEKNLREKLKQIENAINIFSKPVVYVKLDE